MLAFENQLPGELKYLLSCGIPKEVAVKIIEIKRKYENGEYK